MTQPLKRGTDLPFWLGLIGALGLTLFALAVSPLGATATICTKQSGAKAKDRSQSASD